MVEKTLLTFVALKKEKKQKGISQTRPHRETGKRWEMR